jgi:PKD repeat protein
MKWNKMLASQPIPLSVSLILILLGAGCQRVPHVQFSIDAVEQPEAGEVIRFINETKNASKYRWEFGDGGLSYLPAPEYSYDQAGIYTVKLTAYNGEAESFLTRPVTIYEPTQMGFFVFDTSGAPLNSAEVWIYEEKEAWDNQEQPWMAGLTDEEGKSTFLHLEPVIYYIWAFQQGAGGQWYYRGFTPPLVMNDFNWFNVPCIWLPDGPHR